MSGPALDELKRQIPLLDYPQAHDWQPTRLLSRGRLMGLCPLHCDHKPSFLVDPGKSLFYFYGCRRGGDVMRFVEQYHQVKFLQAVTLLYQWRGYAPRGGLRGWLIQLGHPLQALRQAGLVTAAGYDTTRNSTGCLAASCSLGDVNDFVLRSDMASGSSMESKPR